MRERDAVRLCWDFGITGGGPEIFLPRPCRLCWVKFEPPVCSGGPVLDGGRFGCNIGMLAGGSETLRMVLGFGDCCGIIDDADGSVVRDTTRFVRGRPG